MKMKMKMKVPMSVSKILENKYDIDHLSLSLSI